MLFQDVTIVESISERLYTHAAALAPDLGEITVVEYLQEDRAVSGLGDGNKIMELNIDRGWRDPPRTFFTLPFGPAMERIP